MKTIAIFLLSLVFSTAVIGNSLPKGIYMAYFEDWQKADKFEPGYNFIDSDSTGAYFGYYKGGYVVEKFNFKITGDTLTMVNYFNTSKEIFDSSCKTTPKYTQQWTIEQKNKTTYYLKEIKEQKSGIQSDKPYILKWVSDLHR